MRVFSRHMKTWRQSRCQGTSLEKLFLHFHLTCKSSEPILYATSTKLQLLVHHFIVQSPSLNHVQGESSLAAPEHLKFQFHFHCLLLVEQHFQSLHESPFRRRLLTALPKRCQLTLQKATYVLHCSCVISAHILPFAPRQSLCCTQNN